MAATSVIDRLERPSLDRPSLAWPALAAAFGIAAAGVAADVTALAGLGIGAAAGVAVVVAPEVLLALFLSAGIVKSNPLLASVPFDLTLLCGLGVALGMLVRVVRGGVPPLPGATAIFPLLAGLGLLSVFWSPYPEKGLEKALLFETLTMLAFFSPIVLVRRRTELMRFMATSVGIGVFVALTAVETGHPSNPLVAAGGNQIELAMAAALGVLAAFGYLFVVWPNATRILWLVPAGLLATTILKAGSRGVLAGTAVALLFLTVWMAMVGQRARRAMLVVLAVAGVAVVVAGPELAGQAADKYRTGLFSTNAASVIRTRDYVFVQGVELFAAHPMGMGVGGFEAATNEQYPHNLVLEYGSEQGIPAVALFLALFAAACVALARPHVRRTPEAAICGALLILYGVEALVSFGPNESRPLWFAIGLALTLPRFRIDR